MKQLKNEVQLLRSSNHKLRTELATEKKKRVEAETKMSQGSAPCMALLSCDTLQAANALAPTQLQLVVLRTIQRCRGCSEEARAPGAGAAHQ